jgi:enamine deaminase RidA (YjgF/YER057c/UK114 family)
MSIQDRLAELGLTLPQAPAPVAAYVPAVRTGNLIFISGQLPFVNGKLEVTGRLGDGVTLEQGVQAARQAALNALAVTATLVDLNRVRRVVKVTGFVACAPDFIDHPKVVNGASELLVALFGDRGKHARAAVGMASLPLGAPVELEWVVEVE